MRLRHYTGTMAENGGMTTADLPYLAAHSLEDYLDQCRHHRTCQDELNGGTWRIVKVEEQRVY